MSEADTCLVPHLVEDNARNTRLRPREKKFFVEKETKKKVSRLAGATERSYRKEREALMVGDNEANTWRTAVT